MLLGGIDLDSTFLLFLYQTFNVLLYPLKVMADSFNLFGALPLLVGFFGLSIVCAILIPRVRGGK